MDLAVHLAHCSGGKSSGQHSGSIDFTGTRWWWSRAGPCSSRGGWSRRAAFGPDEIERQSPAFVVNLEGSHKADIKMPQEIAGAHVSAPMHSWKPKIRRALKMRSRIVITR